MRATEYHLQNGLRFKTFCEGKPLEGFLFIEYLSKTSRGYFTYKKTPKIRLEVLGYIEDLQTFCA